MSPDPKTDAQGALPMAAQSCPIGVYSHRKGGNYVVFAHSIDESTLEPLVHYYSLVKRTRWTRTIKNFIEQIDGEPRFVRVGDATVLEFGMAVGITGSR